MDFKKTPREEIKINNFSKSDENLAKCFCSLYGHEFMYVYSGKKKGSTGCFYFFNGADWAKDLQNRMMWIRLGIDGLYANLYDMMTIKICENEDVSIECYLYKIRDQLICLQSSAKKESIIRVLKNDLFINAVELISH